MRPCGQRCRFRGPHRHRRDSHLHHLLFSRSSHTLLLRDGAAAAAPVGEVDGAEEADGVEEADGAEGGRVVGGATFRLSQMGGELALTVLVLAVQQKAGVCRRGHGTRLVDALKALLAKEAAARSLQGRMLAQACMCTAQACMCHIALPHLASPRLISLHTGRSRREGDQLLAEAEAVRSLSAWGCSLGTGLQPGYLELQPGCKGLQPG